MTAYITCISDNKVLSSSIYTVIKHIHACYFFRFTSGKYFNLLEDTKVTLDKKKHIKRNRQIFKPVERNKMQPWLQNEKRQTFKSDEKTKYTLGYKQKTKNKKIKNVVCLRDRTPDLRFDKICLTDWAISRSKLQETF